MPRAIPDDGLGLALYAKMGAAGHERFPLLAIVPVNAEHGQCRFSLAYQVLVRGILTLRGRWSESPSRTRDSL